MAPWEAVTTAWRLIGDEDEYLLEITCRLGRKRKMRRVVIGPERAARWMDAIKNSRVSLLPVGRPTCDGSTYELHTGDGFASLRFVWLNVPPEGAEALAGLVGWLWEFVTPDFKFSDE